MTLIYTQCMYLGARTWCYAGHVLCASVQKHDVALDTSYVLPCAHLMLCYTHRIYFGACMWLYAGHVPCTLGAHTWCYVEHNLCTSVCAHDFTFDTSCCCGGCTWCYVGQVLYNPVRVGFFGWKKNIIFFQAPTGMQDEPWSLQMGIEIDAPLLRKLWHQGILRSFAMTIFCYSGLPCKDNCACMTNKFFLAMTYNYFLNGNC